MLSWLLGHGLERWTSWNPVILSAAKDLMPIAAGALVEAS
jgi:hypothetical protein